MTKNLIADPVARRFLELAQYLGEVMASTITLIGRPADGAATPGNSLVGALQQVQGAAAPLLQLLSPGVRDFMQSIGQAAEEEGRAGAQAPNVAAEHPFGAA